jgi:hypothetical protein
MMDSPYRQGASNRNTLPIEPDTRIVAYDFHGGPRAPFASQETAEVLFEAAMPGLRMRSPSKNQWVRSVQVGEGIPDFCVRVRARLDGEPNGIVRVWFRHFTVGNVSIGYLLAVRPLLRQFRVSRYAGNEVEVVTDWSASDHITGPFTPNVIDVAARGHQMMFACNGDLVTLFQDASFGRGAVSVGGTGPTPRDAIVFDSVELCTVKPS